MKISIIVPIYNVEKYLRNCLVSCFNQDLCPDEFEVVLVNDGSTDNSPIIAEEYYSRYKNCKYISQKNGGLSSARNAGIRVAEGDYIWFVDSDDWIQENCLNEILKDCYDNDLDGIIIQGIRVIDGKEYRSKNGIFSSSIIESGIDKMKNHLINCAAVKTIIKRNFFVENDFKFHEGIFHEDQEFTPRIYYSLKRIMESRYYVYYNRQTANSITQSVNPQKGFDLLIVADNLFSFMNSIPSTDRQPYYDFIALNLNQAFGNIINAKQTIKIDFLSKMKEKEYLLKCFFRTGMIKYKIEGILLNYSPFSVLSVYKFFYHSKNFCNRCKIHK